jgi:PEGA domain
MKRAYISSFALAFALSGMSLAAAQDRTSNGNTTGTSVPRGGDGGGSSSGSSSGGSSGSGSSSSSGSMGSSSTSAPSSFPTYEAPRRANEGGQRTRGGASASGDRAVTRGSGGAAPSSGATAASSGFDSSGEPRRAVPAYSRPRDGRPITGTAVERGSVVPPPGGGGSIIYYPYNPWGFWGPGYSYGLGYLFYDPFYYGYGGYGWGDPYGYGYGAGYGGGYGYGGGGSGGYAVSRSYRESGNLRLKIDPKNAEVYVDGYYVGVVDSFDGAFQKLGLDSGNHKIEIKAPGYEATTIDVLITPGETVTYKGDLKRVK